MINKELEKQNKNYLQLRYKINRNEPSVKILGSKFVDYNKDRFYLIVEGEKKTIKSEYFPIID